VDLCLDKTPPPVSVIPLFTHVGAYHVDPVYGDFTPDGLTTAGHYAFTDTIPLRGLMPNGNHPSAIEYRFRQAEYDGAGVVPGAVADIEAPQVAPIIIGQLEYFDWNGAAWVLRSADYWVNNPAALPTTIHRPAAQGGDVTRTLNQLVKLGGWIEAPRENDLTPGGLGLFVGGFRDMLALDTTKLTDENFDLTLPPPALAAGSSVPASQRSRMHRFKLVSEARAVGAVAILSSNEREKIVLSNTHYKQLRYPTWAGGVRTQRAVVLLDITELAAPGAGCNKVNNHVHAL
jgi:hypothetical protein